MKNYQRILTSAVLLCMALVTNAQPTALNTVAEEGAWCWFADARALHYENAAGTINATYFGYIDVHGNVKATQYDWVSKQKTDVLVRSFFQPDDHNNPTFIVLPDERVMVFYTRHTDEAKIWYRISKHPGDISSLGEEKFLPTANNTTYPSPFILSDDPNHIYLCWRGINWHPTIARLTMPDQDDNCQFDFGPKQIVQSTGARPYAKYYSNGKDKIYVAYTTGHPDNEQPNWLYFNAIDINYGVMEQKDGEQTEVEVGPVLRDLNGTQLSIIKNGVFKVEKTDTYASKYPATIVDKTANVRNWVWQVALDAKSRPIIAYSHIDDAKTTHSYWHARWMGNAWKTTYVSPAGHAFHQNWNATERCYSGGMAIDTNDPDWVVVSVPKKNGEFNKDGVYELSEFAVDENGVVGGTETFVTFGSEKNNVRPYVIPGSKNSPMKMGWMSGDYYYWMVNKNYPLGFPTKLVSDYDWQEELTPEEDIDRTDCICLAAGKTVTMVFNMDESKYEGTLFTINHYEESDGGLVYRINAADQRPEVSINGTVYKSQNRLLTSDEWAKSSTGTNGDNHPTKLKMWVLTLSYDGKRLTIYRNGLVDQVIESGNIPTGTVDTYGEEDGNGQFVAFNHTCLHLSDYYRCASPFTVQWLAAMALEQARVAQNQSLPRELQNGDFEGSYAPMQGSGVSTDRAIYLPEGWSIDYSDRNNNDLSALKAGDLYFSNFFASRPKPSSDSNQTYWVRQNWGTSTIALYQEMLLPEGKYQMTADVWKSGLGGDVIISVSTQDGATQTAPSLENKEAWQKVSLGFESNGSASTTVRLAAMHNYNGSEKIIGFDNVKVAYIPSVGIETTAATAPITSTAVYDLQGRRVGEAAAMGTLPKGIYLKGDRKFVVR